MYKMSKLCKNPISLLLEEITIEVNTRICIVGCLIQNFNKIDDNTSNFTLIITKITKVIDYLIALKFGF